jgi:uncharacterized protein YndB with AHSA1/START domain
MKNVTTYVGIDAHKKDLFVAMLIGNEKTPVTWQLANEPSTVRRLVRKLEREGPGPVQVFYEAGPCGWFVAVSLSCEMDARLGGTYRLTFSHPASPEPMAFFGRYKEVVPHSRLVWTNDEGGEDGPVTTVTFEERGAETLVVVHDLYPSKEALDAAIASGSTGGFTETFEQLDELLGSLGASVGRS